ncbi:MAG: choline-sulfatase [Verrucomicrobiales bacterium]|jgi:choline-sulfatase
MKFHHPIAALLFLLPAASIPAAERPNILFIFTDDQDPFSLGAYGNTVCHTPNIDRIAREGMLIHDAHHMGSWSGAVCRPSRTMLMTGRSVWNIPGAPSSPGGKKRKGKKNAGAANLHAVEVAKQSMAAVFNAAGYDTFRTCKKGNSFRQANEHFTVRYDGGDRRAADGSQWHGGHAMDFLDQRESTKDEDPFLMFFGFAHPHDPRNGMPELLEKYGAVNTEQPPTTFNPKAPPLPGNYLPKHPFFHGHPGLRDEDKVQGVMTSRSEATIRNEIGRYYACIENIDQQVGRVLKKIEAMGELDNTYVIFTSDHGMAIGRHGLQGKQNLYEHTWRVPMLVRGPGIKAGSEASGFLYLMDVLPTICDLASIDQPKGVNGLSFRSVLEGKKNRLRETLYGTYSGGTKPGMRSVKTSDGWKLIKYDTMDGKVRETQLFNLNDNPDEFLDEHKRPGKTDLAEDPKYANKRIHLESLLLNEMQRLKDPYRLWDQPAAE